jgi:predicted house-cleaning noncanonical NTP pyrophosphatase (MazG superfamily)
MLLCLNQICVIFIAGKYKMPYPPHNEYEHRYVNGVNMGFSGQHDKCLELHIYVSGSNLHTKVARVEEFINKLKSEFKDDIEEIYRIINSRYSEGWSPLMAVCDYSASLAIAKALINAFGNRPNQYVKDMVNSANQSNNTPLTIAASFGKWEIAKLLVENGADLSIKKVFRRTTYNVEQTPFEFACEEGATDFVLFCIETNRIQLSEARRIMDEQKLRAGNKKKKFFQELHNCIYEKAACPIEAAWQGYSERKNLANPHTYEGRVKVLYNAYKQGFLPKEEILANANAGPYLERIQSNVYSTNPKEGQTSQGKSGGNQHIKHKGRKYVVRTGPKGGKYILVNKEKVYV